jgi:NAD(P)-dependent dehydrogenase (short-subunit alcohol dehydrogenase family)
MVRAASTRTDFIATAHVLDITHEAAVNDTLENICKNFGRIDYAVNNAGVCKSDEGGLAAATTETWRRMIGVNLGKAFSITCYGAVVP